MYCKFNIDFYNNQLKWWLKGERRERDYTFESLSQTKTNILTINIKFFKKTT